jgi:Flp pilus assembly protein TadB
MSLDALKSNISQTKEITRELYVFTDQLSKIKNLETNSRVVIDTKEKKLLKNSIDSLTNMLKILNNSLPGLIEMIKFYKELETNNPQITPKKKEKFIQIKYKPSEEKEKVTLAIESKFKKQFLADLSQSNLSINQLKKRYSTEKPQPEFTKPHIYAKISNRLFRKYSNRLIARKYFDKLNRNLRKINSQFIIGTYVSMIFLTMMLGFFTGIFLFAILLFFDISLLFPFISIATESIPLRIIKFFWVIFATPLFAGFLMYIYPASESKNLSSKINQELPFVTIHMSAVASSGIEPTSIFKIVLKNPEYKYTNKSMRKIMNLINFHGFDLVSALKHASKSSPSTKLRELLGGMSNSITSGGNLHQYLEKRSERLLFDYKLEREKYTKTAETFMNIYISLVIAAPMIFLMLFVIIGGTGLLSSFIGLSIDLLGILIILAIVLLNLGFLLYLKWKQPTI